MEDQSDPVKAAASKATSCVQSTGTNVEYESIFHDEDLGEKNLLLYFAACLLCNGLICALTISLWSSMWLGDASVTFLMDNDGYKYYPFCASLFILLIMYLLDLFLPPFVPEGGLSIVAIHNVPGRALLAIACLLFLMSCFLMAKSYPHVPMILTIFLCPGSTALVRNWIKPTHGGKRTPQQAASQILKKGDVEKKMRCLKDIVGEEKDVTAFYRGAMYSFFTCSFASLLAWLLWWHSSDEHLHNFLKLSETEMEDKFIKWVCPLVLAISNLVFALFVFLRVAMQHNYARTDIYRAQLVAAGMTSSMHDDMKTHRMTLNLARLTNKGGGGTSSAELEPQNLDERYSAQHATHIRQLSMIVKVVACTFVIFIGLLYVATQLLYANVYVASMVLGMLGSFFLVFVVFTYLSFKRIVDAMGQWIKDLPVWKTVKWVLQRDVVRAQFICAAAPAIPLALALSILNQYVRKLRGGYNNIPPNAVEELGQEPAKLLLTPRVAKYLRKVKSWNWLSITWWCYMWSAAFVAYNLTPPVLNVGLSWMREALRLWPFALILVMTFVIGVGAFLCPVVPGMTVYIFGGLIVANTCPPLDRGWDAWIAFQVDTQTSCIVEIDEEGFWMGSIINIGLSWFLKLAACAVQQKFIGELLGSRMWVRRQVGVHKTHIRCIESILSKRGWTVGKVAILCGGPDWPTSVLAGVLRLSLFQCELGTLPIIFFVAPCAMTGSFYLRKGSGDMWERAANLMIIVSVFVNLLLWAISAWAVAQELEQNSEKLTAPLPQNVDLVWLDYKADEVEKRCKVTWADVPKCIRSLYVFGAIVHITVCHALFWAYSYLIGSFQVQDPIDKLQAYSGTLYFSGSEVCEADDCDCKIELFSLGACITIGLYIMSWSFYFQFTKWRAAKQSAPRKIADDEISKTEAAWKEEWLKTASGSQTAVVEQAAPAAETAAPTAETAAVTDPAQLDVFEQVPDAADNAVAEEPPPATSLERLEAAEPPPQLRVELIVEEPPPPMSLVTSDLSKTKGEPVQLKAISMDHRDMHEDLRELPMPVSDAVESRGLSRRDVDQSPDMKLETCETMSSSAEQSRRRSYIECICCQLASTGSPVVQGEPAKTSL